MSHKRLIGHRQAGTSAKAAAQMAPRHLLCVLLLALVLVLSLLYVGSGKGRNLADAQTAPAGSAQAPQPARPTAQASGRQEVVYANLKSDGSLDHAYCVNKLELKGKGGAVVDYGDFSAVQNLTDLTPLSLDAATAQAPAGVTVDTTAKQLYYQGDLVGTTLPWDFRVTYRLDGKPVSADQLAGASGHLQIEFKSTKSDYTNQTFYKNYVLQTQVTLDTAKCRNIKAKAAQMAVAGSNSVASFTTLPKKDADDKISADVTDFEMPAISITAVPFNMAFDVDTSSMTGGFSQLSKAVSKLDGSGDKLAAASAKIKSALDTVDHSLQGTDFDSSDLSKLPGALKTIATSLRDQIAANLPDQGSASQMAALVNASNIDTLAGQPGTAAQIAGLISALPSMKAGIDTAAGSLDTMAASLQGALGKVDIGSELTALKKGMHSLASNYATFNTGIQAYMDGVAALNHSTADLPAAVQKQVDKFMQSYQGGDFKPTSFLSSHNKHTTACQFVIQTAQIKLPSAPSVAASGSTDQTSFWQRLLSLFGL
ncbi:MAG: hypothetical protein LBL67_02180 [Coriobacteriales bacterium]|nr:hypothetical protein [Coriobacteriales bacterium]